MPEVSHTVKVEKLLERARRLFREAQETFDELADEAPRERAREAAEDASGYAALALRALRDIEVTG